MERSRLRILLTCLAALLIVALACGESIPTPTANADAVATAVAATYTAAAGGGGAVATTPVAVGATATNTLLDPTQTLTLTIPAMATASATTTATNSPPPGGVSLNCDGTYQKVRITDGGASGKTVSVDNWVGGNWVNVWNLDGGDPMIRQILPEAGYYQFGGCQNLVIVPLRHSKPHVYFELSIHVWNGGGMTQVYYHEGAYGEWTKNGDVIEFLWASAMGSVNNGPLEACEWTTLYHTWDGSAFILTGSQIDTVPNCVITVP